MTNSPSVKTQEGKERKCKHDVVEVWTQYFRNKPAQVVRAYCSKCETAMPEIRGIYQDREDKIYEAYGNKPPVVILDDRIETVIEKRLRTKYD